jgi:hypothetical protein
MMKKLSFIRRNTNAIGSAMAFRCATPNDSARNSPFLLLDYARPENFPLTAEAGR